MPGPLLSMVKQLGLDDPTQASGWSPDMLAGIAQQYPQFAEALQDSIHLNLTGPNIIGGPEPPQLSPEQMQQQMPGAQPPPYHGPALDPAAAQLQMPPPMAVSHAQAPPSSQSDAPLGALAPYLEGGMNFLRGATGLGDQGPAGQTWTNAGAVLAAGLPVVGELKGAAQLAQRWPRMAKVFEQLAPEVRMQIDGQNRSFSAALDRVATTIHQDTLQNGGATIHPLTGEVQIPNASTGFMVGKYSSQSGRNAVVPLQQFTPNTVRNFMEQHADAFARDHNLAVGSWIDRSDPNQPRVYLDVAQKKDTARQAAVAGARQSQPATDALTGAPVVRDPTTGQWPMPQKAIFDLQAGAERPIGNFAEFVGGPGFQDRLDTMYHAGVPVMNGKEWWNLYGSDLERVYGKERVAPLAGFLASTSPASAPVHNLRAASEYLRRLIKDEPIIQPHFRLPDTAVGSLPTSMGAMTPGDFNAPGTLMPMEQTRAPNLQRVAAGNYAQLQKDKVNDMFHALTGMDVGVYDRRYAKLAEDWKNGIYVDATKDKVPGTMGTTQVSPYALIENAVRTGARRHNMPLGRFSAYVWEGIGDTIKRTGELYGMAHQAHSIPTASQGFPGIFNAMVAEKAQAWGITVAEMERRLRSGDAELLTALLATPVGLAAYRQWQSVVGEPAEPGPQ